MGSRRVFSRGGHWGWLFLVGLVAGIGGTSHIKGYVTPPPPPPPRNFNLFVIQVYNKWLMDATLTINLVGPSPRDPLSIYHLAQSFYLAANRAALNIDVGPGVTQSLVSPAVVNFCFAIELFCKALIVMQGGAPPKKHSLVDLFSAIPKSTQEQIKNSYAQFVTDPNLETLLGQVSEYFQQVRYSYEYNIFNYQETPLAILAREFYIYCAQTLSAEAKADPING